MLAGKYTHPEGLSLMFPFMVGSDVETIKETVKHIDESDSFFKLWIIGVLKCFCYTLTKDLRNFSACDQVQQNIIVSPVFM